MAACGFVCARKGATIKPSATTVPHRILLCIRMVSPDQRLDLHELFVNWNLVACFRIAANQKL